MDQGSLQQTHLHFPGNSQRSSPMFVPASGTEYRPGSALARGVKITEYHELSVNPDPIIEEESNIILEGFLSPRRLVSHFAMFNNCNLYHCFKNICRC